MNWIKFVGTVDKDNNPRASQQINQCPIRIVQKKTVPYSLNSGLPFFKPTPIYLNRVRITNTGSTIQIFLNDPNAIHLYSNFAKYKFAQAHFHWGMNDRMGSETHIDNEKYAFRSVFFFLSLRFLFFRFVNNFGFWYNAITDFHSKCMWCFLTTINLAHLKKHWTEINRLT